MAKEPLTTCRYLGEDQKCLAKMSDGKYVDGEKNGEKPARCACVPVIGQDPASVATFDECIRITAAVLNDSARKKILSSSRITPANS